MAYVDTGLGWYLDENYLLTLGNQTLGTVGGGSPSYPEPSTVAPYDGPFSNIPAQSPGFALNYYPPGHWWTAVWQETNIGTAMCWNFLVGSTQYGVTNVQGTVTRYYGGGSGGTTAINNPMPGYPGFYYYTVSSWQFPSNFTFSTLAEAMAIVQQQSAASVSVTKVQGGAGAFAFVSYPKNGATVHVGVGISSIPNPNSAATVAVDGVNGSYNTFNRDGIEFTMYYTGQLAGELTANVPVVTRDTDISSIPSLYETRLFLAVANAAQIHTLPIPTEDDPYAGGGTSEPGGGNGTFDFDSTEIDFGAPPTVTAAGMVELYVPSTANLASLAQYLWAGSFDPDNFKKLFADPMDAIIGLQIVPVTATQIGTTPDTLYVGNLSTGLSMPKASRQYVPVDCGSLSIPRRLGSYLDYSPHTEMQLYLPYIGFVDISPDDCMGGTVSVKYMVDIIGGTCVAQVKCNNHVLYEFAAACSCQVPVSAGQYQNIVLGAVRGGVALVSGILGAAGGGLFSGLSEAADAAMSMTKPKIQRSGGFGGSSGLMGHQTPYIIYTVPRLIVPGSQNNFIGYPSYITRTLGNLTGFTQIDSIHLSGIPASQSEQAEIEQLLQEGVYL